MPNISLPDSLTRMIAERNARDIVRLFFDGNPPHLRPGFYREDPQWDFKAGCPSLRRENELAWAKIAALVLAFHNATGGVIFFGIEDAKYSFCGTATPLDANQFNAKIRRYVGDTFWVPFNREFIQPQGTYLGVAVVPPHGLTLKRLQAAAPLENGRPFFEAGDLPIRIGDETRIFRGADALHYLSSTKQPALDSRFLVDEPGYRITTPDYDEFVARPELCEAVMKGLRDDRTFVTSLTGIGGAGKTALASWGVVESYKAAAFDFIICLSAKDRELSAVGIQPVTPGLTSFTNLLDEILDLTGFSDAKSEDEAERERIAREIISGEHFLFFIDNLETIDDARILRFLETLPRPVKAIITSRRARVRHSIFPVDVGTFSKKEALQFLQIQAERRGKEFLLSLGPGQKEDLVRACSFLPLVLEWFVGRVRDADDTAHFIQALMGSSKVGEELLEFCFRRIHTDLSPPAKRCLKVMSILEKPESLEPIAAGARLPTQAADDALEELRLCSLVEAAHDAKAYALTYTMLPLTRKFAYEELVRDVREESDIRRELVRYFEAADIVDANQRRIVSEVRQGVRVPESAFLEMAIVLRKAGRYGEAERYYLDAIAKNPKSWKVYRESAEYYRHLPVSNIREALRLYEQAVQYAPKKGRDRGLIYREFGILLRDSGLPGSVARAREALEEALAHFTERDDSVCRHALGDVYMKLSARRKAVEVLEPLLNHPYAEQRQKTYPLLEELYKLLGEPVRLAMLRDKRDRDSGQDLNA